MSFWFVFLWLCRGSAASGVQGRAPALALCRKSRAGWYWMGGHVLLAILRWLSQMLLQEAFFWQPHRRPHTSTKRHHPRSQSDNPGQTSLQ